MAAKSRIDAGCSTKLHRSGAVVTSTEAGYVVVVGKPLKPTIMAI